MLAADRQLEQSDEESVLRDAYSWFESRLSIANKTRGFQSLLFASAVPGEGKTTTAANLAILLARRGHRVLLVDADMRCGSLAKMFGRTPIHGLTSLLQDEVHLEETIETITVDEHGHAVDLLDSGPRVSDVVRLLRSPQLGKVLRLLESSYEIVIVDSPPLNLVPDAAVLAGEIGGVVLVVRAGATDVDALAYAMEQLHAVSAPVIGTLLNGIDPERETSYDGAYRYLGASKYANAG